MSPPAPDPIAEVWEEAEILGYLGLIWAQFEKEFKDTNKSKKW